MADITKVKVILNSGVSVNVSALEDTALTVQDLGDVIQIFNSAMQTIASFSKLSVAYWTTDLAEVM